MMTVETFRQLMGTTPSWFDQWLGFLEPQIVTVSDLCSANPVDPGAPPAPITAPVFGLPALPNPDFFNWALEKMQYFEFTKVCVCSTSFPTCNTVTPWTADTSTYTPGTGTTVNLFTANTSGQINQIIVKTKPGWSVNTTLYIWDNATTVLLSSQSWPTPHATGFNTINLATPVAVTAGHQYAVGIDMSGQNWEYSANSLWTANTDFTPQGLCTVGTFGTYCNAAGGANAVQMFPVLCTNTPTATIVPTQPTSIILPTSPTCSTTGDICSILSQIQTQVQSIYGLLTIFQRRERPFAWIPGSLTIGLTGHGTIAVQDIIGAIVSVTSVPIAWGQTTDVPARGIPAYGSIQWSDGTNYSDWELIHYRHQLLTAPSWATTLSYSLKPGITASITPISPEA